MRLCSWHKQTAKLSNFFLRWGKLKWLVFVSIHAISPCQRYTLSHFVHTVLLLELIQWMFLEKMRHCSSFLMVRHLNNIHLTYLTMLVKQLLLLVRSIVIMGSDVFSTFFSCFMYVTISYYFCENYITLKSGYQPGIYYAMQTT